MRNWRETLETVVFSAILTLVIWLWAEGESVSVETVTVTVTFTAPEGSRLLIEPRTPPPVNVVVEGATRQLRAFRERFGDETIEHTLRYEPDAPLERQIVVEDLLESAGMSQLGVTIRNIQPQTLAVRVEQLVDVTVPIRVRTGEVRLAGPVKTQPEAVVVTVPESLEGEAEAAAVDVALPRRDLGESARNQPQSETVNLSIPAELRTAWTRMSPNTAELIFTLEDVTAEVTLRSVPVFMSASPVLMRRYEVDVPEEQRVLRDVRLSGPSEIIERIRDRSEPRVVAEFRPSENDLAAGEATLPLTLRVPAGVTIESPIPAITVTAQPRADNGG